MANEGLTHLSSRQQLSQVLSDEATAAQTLEAIGDGTAGLTNRIGLLLIDVDRFASITAALGPDGGEQVLATIAGRMRAALRPSQILVRLGGDEFAVVLPDADRDVAGRVAQDLLGQLDEPLTVSWGQNTENMRTETVRVDASVGSATVRLPREDPSTLVAKATQALARAKEDGGGISHFDPLQAAPIRMRPKAELQLALEREQVQVYLQPQINLQTGAVCGAEALARWRHPTDGVLLPASFLPLATQTGLLRPIATAVLDLSLRAAVQWWEAGHEIPVSVNLTPSDLLDPELTDRVPQCLEPFGLPPKALRIEITEDVFLSDTATVAALLRRWHRQGVTVALDDFGTGYSSLSYLRELPIDELKLDRAFISDLGRRTTATIVRHTIAMAHDLDLVVVAEGIEDAATAHLLTQMGCDVGQGQHFATAMPVDEFVTYLTAPARTD